MMNIKLVKHILYILRCTCNGSEFRLDFDSPNKTMRHSFTVKSNYIGYARLESGEVIFGFDCTNLDLLQLEDTEFIPVSYTKTLYNYDDNGIYSTETINIRYEIEIAVRLAKELNSNLYFQMETPKGVLDFVYIDGMLFWVEETSEIICTRTCNVYELHKVLGDYKITWIYGKSSYSKPYYFYDSKEKLAKGKMKQFKKTRRV